MGNDNDEVEKGLEILLPKIQLMWTTIQIILVLITILLVLAGEKLSMPILFDAGVVCLGLTSIAIGWEAILTRRIRLGWRRHGGTQTYTGLPAMLQGAQFNLIGLFLIGASFMMYFNNGREVALQIVRRPGLFLIVLGGLCLLQSVISFIGQQGSKDSARWVEITYLLLARLLPGFVLLALGLALVGLGVFEVLAPTAFDKMGGGFLESLYRLR